jgi:surface protein/bartonella adhesin
MKKSFILMSILAATNVFADTNPHTNYSGDAETIAMQKCGVEGNICVNTFNHDNSVQANNQGTVAIGQDVIVNGLNAMAIGSGTESHGSSSIVFGTQATAGKDADTSIVIGERSSTEASRVVAIGSKATAAGSGSVAIGSGVKGDGEASIALGNGSVATAKYATALQVNSQAHGIQSIAFGRGANTSENSDYSVAIGSYAKTSNESAFALGTLANASAKEAQAIGSYSEASVEGSTAIGSYSKATVDKGVSGANPLNAPIENVKDLPWTSTYASVSVGDVENGITRQITNVSAGTKDTDVVNVAQLSATAKAAKTEVKAGQNVTINETKGANGQSIYTLSAKDDSASVSAGSNAVSVNKGKLTNSVQDYVVDLSKETKVTLNQVNVNKADIVGLKMKNEQQDAEIVGLKAKNQQQDVEIAKAKTEVKAGQNTFVTETKGSNGQSIYTIDSKQAVVTGVDGIAVTKATSGLNTIYNVGLSNQTKATLNQVGVNTQNIERLSGAVEKNSQSIAALERKFDKVEDRQNAIGATANAAAALMQVHHAGQSAVSAAVGYYGDEAAVAVGVSSLSDMGKWGFKAHVNYNTQEKIGVGASIGYFF